MSNYKIDNTHIKLNFYKNAVYGSASSMYVLHYSFDLAFLSGKEIEVETGEVIQRLTIVW